MLNIEYINNAFMLLKSRLIFRNWFLLFLRYLYCKFIKRNALCKMIAISRDGRVCIINPLIYGNILHGFYFGFIHSVICSNDYIIIDGLKLKICKKNNENELDLGLVRFRRWYDSLSYIYITNQYSILNVKGAIVIDVGAYVGDSAIYFALKGAKKVIAIEPNPEAFKEMLDNIKFNNMKDKIYPINAGLISKIHSNNLDGNSKCLNVFGGINEAYGIYYYDIVAYNKLGNKCVEAISMAEIIKLIPNEYLDNVVLKMDCEGCEFDVISNDYEHIKLFRELILEYHNNPTNLIKILENDFKCYIISKYNLLYCRKKL